MQEKTIAAKDVEVGDYLYNSLAKHDAFRWCRVMEVKRAMWTVRLEHSGEVDVPCVELHTSGWYTVKSLGEGIFVRRGSRDG